MQPRAMLYLSARRRGLREKLVVYLQLYNLDIYICGIARTLVAGGYSGFASGPSRRLL